VISKEAQATEALLAMRLNADPLAVRAYFTEVLEERLWHGGEKSERRTGFKFVRGSHGGTYVHDPKGTDILPPSVEPPPS
jgi:hypothetical protein